MDHVSSRDFTGSATERLQKLFADPFPRKFVYPEDHHVDAPLYLVGPAEIYGVWGKSRIVRADPTMDMLVCYAEVTDGLNKIVPLYIHDLTLDSSVPATAGHGIACYSRPFWRWGVQIDRVTFRRQFNSLGLLTCAGAVVSDCRFWRAENCEIVIDNDVHADAGDNEIRSCYFADKPEGAMFGIYQIGAGGTRLTSCKFLWYAWQYYLDVPAGREETGILIVSGGSYEHARRAAFRLGGEGTWWSAQLDHVEIDSYVGAAIVVDGDRITGGHITNCLISNPVGVDFRRGRAWSAVGNKIYAAEPFKIAAGFEKEFSRTENEVNGAIERVA